MHRNKPPRGCSRAAYIHLALYKGFMGNILDLKYATIAWGGPKG